MHCIQGLNTLDIQNGLEENADDILKSTSLIFNDII